MGCKEKAHGKKATDMRRGLRAMMTSAVRAHRSGFQRRHSAAGSERWPSQAISGIRCSSRREKPSICLDGYIQFKPIPVRTVSSETKTTKRANKTRKTQSLGKWTTAPLCWICRRFAEVWQRRKATCRSMLWTGKWQGFSHHRFQWNIAGIRPQHTPTHKHPHPHTRTHAHTHSHNELSWRLVNGVDL